MSIRNLALAAALGLSMASAPVMAQASAVERTSATLDQASGQDNPPRGRGRGRGPVDDGPVFGGTTTYIIGIFVIIVIAIGIFFAFDEEDEDRTTP